MVGYFWIVGEKYFWKFENYWVIDGYVNMLLDGIWMCVFYLYNGFVLILMDFLVLFENWFVKFYCGCMDFDFDKVGFFCEEGFVFDMVLFGNGNGGYFFGIFLLGFDKVVFVEFFKML